jgi:hypothetical protein
MENDGLSRAQAEAEIKAAQKQFYKYLERGDTESAYDICEEFFGLEPDYVMELI